MIIEKVSQIRELMRRIEVAITPEHNIQITCFPAFWPNSKIANGCSGLYVAQKTLIPPIAISRIYMKIAGQSTVFDIDCLRIMFTSLKFSLWKESTKHPSYPFWITVPLDLSESDLH